MSRPNNDNTQGSAATCGGLLVIAACAALGWVGCGSVSANSNVDAGDGDASGDAALADTAPPDAVIPAGTVSDLQQLASTGELRVMDVALRPSGDRYALAGYFDGSIVIAGEPVATNGNDDIFVALFEVGQATPVWVKAIGGAGNDIALGVDIDAGGNVLVGGRMGDGENITVDGTLLTSKGLHDIFLAKLAGTSGQALWARSAGGVGYDGGFDLAADATGNVVISGYFNNQASFDTNVTRTGDQETVVIAKYTGANGGLEWVSTFGDTSGQFVSPGADIGHGIAVDGSGDVIATGYFQNTVTFGTDTLASKGDRDVYVVKLDGTSGGVEWARGYGGSGSERAWRVATGGNDGRVGVVGRFSGDAIIGDKTFSAIGSSDVFVLVLGADGTPIWSRQLDGDTGEYYGYGVAIDKAGRLILAGRFQSGTDFGGGDVTAVGGTDLFAARYLADGGFDFAVTFGGSGTDSALAAATDDAGNILVGGYFSGTVNFDLDSLTSTASLDGVAVLLTP